MVAKINGAAAYMTVNGKDSRAFRVGQEIAKGIKVTAISDSSVTLLRKGKKPKRIAIGEEALL